MKYFRLFSGVFLIFLGVILGGMLSKPQSWEIEYVGKSAAFAVNNLGKPSGYLHYDQPFWSMELTAFGGTIFSYSLILGVDISVYDFCGTEIECDRPYPSDIVSDSKSGYVLFGVPL